MKTTLLTIALLATACGEYRHQESYVHPDLQDGVAQFNAELKGRGTYDIQVITFGSLPSPQMGVCRTYTDGTRQVIIADEMKFASEDFLLDTLFHELIHCALDANHDPEGTGGIMEAEGNEMEVEQGGGAIARLRAYLLGGV